MYFVIIKVGANPWHHYEFVFNSFIEAVEHILYTVSDSFFDEAEISLARGNRIIRSNVDGFVGKRVTFDNPIISL